MEEIVYLKPSQLIPNTIVRGDVQSKTARQKLKSLERSIQARGIQTPLIVIPGEKGYLIADGNRRFLAGLRVGVKAFPCILRENEGEEGMAITEVGFSANELRQDLKPSQELSALESVAEEGRFSLKEISESTGKTYSQLKKIHQRRSLAGSILERMDHKRISQSAAVELAPLPEEEQEIAVQALEEMGFNPTVENIRLYRGESASTKKPPKERDRIEESLGTAAQELDHLKQIYSDLEKQIGWAHAVVAEIWGSEPARRFIQSRYPEISRDFETVLEVLGGIPAGA